MRIVKLAITKSRQPVSGFSHLLGALFSLVGLVWLWSLSTHDWKLVSVVVFCGSMVLLYTASSLYHLLPLTERGLKRLRKFDHAMIYLFIAGCYTPVCLVPFRETWGWTVFAIVWSLAITGILVKLFYLESSRWLRVSFYMGLSFISVFIVPAIIQILPAPGVWLLFSGAGAYMLGAIVYGFKRPNPIPDIFGFHEIWHLFVLCGTSCHFWMMKEYILKI